MEKLKYVLFGLACGLLASATDPPNISTPPRGVPDSTCPAAYPVSIVC